MNRILYFLGFIFLLMINCHCINDDSRNDDLLTKKRIVKEISGGQIDTFCIKLENNKFIFASLFQMGIDICVKIIDPQNDVIQEIDNLRSGPEFISLTTRQAGVYKILALPFNPMAGTGKYSIGLEKNINTNNSKEELVCQLFAEFDNDYRPGAAVAIVKDGNVIYKSGFGISDFDKKTPINPSTRLNICSIGKQFTAFAIALLEHEGKLSINDDIRNYIPEIYDFGESISIQNLLNHSSGLREIADILEISGKRCNGPFSKEDVIKLICRQKELNFKPGTEYFYCNTGYILLAEIIERVTNKPYIEWITENIFKPLGMNNTYIYHDPDDFVNDYAWSYTLDNDRNYKKEKLYKAWYVGAGNVFSTVEDMSKWLINFDYPKVGNAQIISTLEKNKISMNKDSTEFYTFGRVLSNYKGLKYYWHGGGGYGYTAQIVHFPDYKFGAIVLSNFIYGGVHGRARQIADIYLNDHFTVTDPIYFEYRNPYKPVKVNNKILSDIEGRYQNDSGVISKITRERDGLFVQTSGFDKSELFAMSDSVFFLKETDLKIYFLRDRSGRVIKMISYNKGEESVSNKLDNIPDKSINYKPYEGKYYSEELDAYYTLYQSGNTLVARNNVNGEITLTHTKENIFKGNRWYFSLVEFGASNNLEINEFRITNDRVKNIRFKKVIN